MKKLFRYIPFFILLIITGVFFYKTLLFGLIPFPGDLLVSEYKPWQTYSYLGYNPGSVPDKAQYFDTIRQLYPWKIVTSQIFKSGQLPLWNPYNFSGSPLLANFQSAVFYPLTILYLLLPLPVAWTLGVVLQHLLAGLFTYLFGRKHGLSKAGALLAAISYSFSLFMIVFSQYNTIGQTIAWLPLILLAVDDLVLTQRPFVFVLLVAALAASLFAGHLQLFGLLLVYAFVYAAFRIGALKESRHRKIQKILYITLAFVLGLGIGAVQLAPTLELLRNSARTTQPYQFLVEKLLIQPYEVVKLFSPDLFGNPATRNYLLTDTYPSKALYAGLIPLIFALLALIYRRKERIIQFFGVSVVVLFLFLVRSPLTEVFYRLNIPVVSSSSPTNALFLVGFALAILSGYGVDTYRQRKNVYGAIVCVSMLYAVLLVCILGFRIPIQLNNALYTAGLLGCLFIGMVITGITKSWNKFGVGFILILATLDLFYFFQKFNPFVPNEFVFPSTSIALWLKNNAGVNRFWGYGSAAVEANFSSALALYSPDGYDPLYPKQYGKLLAASDKGVLPDTFTNQTRSDAVITPGYGELDLPSNVYRLKLLNILGTKYILDRVENRSTIKTFPADTYDPVYESDGWKIFENKAVLPRAFLTAKYRVYSDDTEFVNIFFDPAFQPSETILLETPIAQPLGNSDTPGTASILDYLPNRLRIRTNSQNNSLLFLSDTYYPGWKAYVDGKESPVYRAHYAFRAVFVPSGTHDVVFHYQPDSFYFGAKISMISAGLLVLGSVIIIRKRKIV